MDVNELSSVYIMVDDDNRIIRCDGGYTTPTDLAGWVKIDEGTGDKYNLCQNHYFDRLYTKDMIPRYKLVDGSPVERTEDEIEADRATIPEQPEPELTVEERVTNIENAIERGFAL